MGGRRDGWCQEVGEEKLEKCCKEQGQLAEASEEDLGSTWAVVPMMMMVMMMMPGHDKVLFGLGARPLFAIRLYRWTMWTGLHSLISINVKVSNTLRLCTSTSHSCIMYMIANNHTRSTLVFRVVPGVLQCSHCSVETFKKPKTGTD